MFNIFLDTSRQTARWLLVEPCGDNNYKLTINMKHPFFKPLIAKKEFMPIMMRMSIALVLAEIEASFLSSDGKINPSDIRIKMNDILENIIKDGNTILYKHFIVIYAYKQFCLAFRAIDFYV